MASLQRWGPLFYKSCGKKELYKDKLAWTEDQYQQYFQMCVQCCRLYISAEITGQHNLATTLASALREHVLGDLFDKLISSKILSEDHDAFYKTTIFRFNTSVKPLDRRSGGPLPAPTARVTVAQLESTMSTTSFGANGRSSRHLGPDVKADLATVSESLDDLKISNIGDDPSLSQHQPLFAETPLILPTWSSSWIELHIFNAEGVDLARTIQCRIALGRLRNKPQFPLNNESDSVNPSELEYSRLHAIVVLKCQRFNVAATGFQCFSLRRQGADGSKQKWTEIGDEDDIEGAYRRYQQVCLQHNKANTIWPVYVVNRPHGYDVSPSDDEEEKTMRDTSRIDHDVSTPRAIDHDVSTPRAIDDDASIPRAIDHDANTPPSVDCNTHTTEDRIQKRKRVDKPESKSADTDSDRSKRTRRGLDTSPPHMKNAVRPDRVSVIPPSAPGRIDLPLAAPENQPVIPAATSDASPQGTSTRRKEEKPARLSKQISSPDTAMSSKDISNDLKEAPLAPELTFDSQRDDSNGLGPGQDASTWDLQTWASKALSLNEDGKLIDHGAGDSRDVAIQFEGAASRKVTEQMTIQRLLDFHSVFKLPGSPTLTRETKLPIPGGTGLGAFMYQCLGVLFLEEKNDTFMGALLADQQGLGKTFMVWFLIFRRRYRNMVWDDIAADRDNTRHAADLGEQYTPIHLPSDYDPELGTRKCPVAHLRPWECPCEKKTEFTKKKDDGWTLVFPIASAGKDPWVNDSKAWFQAAEVFFGDASFAKMHFLVRDQRKFKLLIAHDATLRSIEANERADHQCDDTLYESAGFPVNDDDSAHSEILQHEPLTDHIIVLTTYQSEQLLMRAIGHSNEKHVKSHWYFCYPRWIIIDEAHTYKCGGTAVPGFIDALLKYIEGLRAEKVRQVDDQGKSRRFKRYSSVPKVSIFPLSGTPFAGNFVVDFGNIWLPFWSRLRTIAGHDAGSLFDACNTANVEKMDRYFNQQATPHKFLHKSTSESDRQVYVSKFAHAHVQKVTSALETFMIKRDWQTTLWGTQVVNLPPLKCYIRRCWMTDDQVSQANHVTSKKLVEAHRDEQMRVRDAKRKGKAIPSTTRTLLDRVSAIPSVPAHALFPNLSQYVHKWKVEFADEEGPWDLSSHQIGEKGWWHDGRFQESPYAKYGVALSHASHKWAPLKEILTKSLNTKIDSFGGFTKVLVVTRSGANVLLLYLALRELASQLARKWNRTEGIHVAKVVSQVPIDERTAIYEKFNKGDEADVSSKFKNIKSADILVVSSKCFGVGQNMGRATVMVIMEPQTSVQLTLQLPGRMRRINGTESVRSYTLLGTKCTNDEIQHAQNSRDTSMMDSILRTTVEEARQRGAKVPAYKPLVSGNGGAEDTATLQDTIGVSDDEFRGELDGDEGMQD